MKLYLLAVTLVFHLAACSFQESTLPAKKTHPTYLSQQETHTLLKQWQRNHYRSTDRLKVSFHSEHKLAPKFNQLISGISISRFATRSKGNGLPVAVSTKKHHFSVITQNAYQSHLYKGTLIAKRLSPDQYKLTLYNPLNPIHSEQLALRRQENILIDHLTNLPGNSRLKFKGLFNPQRYQYTKGIYLTEPYNPKKIPILMIHGILSTPETFTAMADRIEQDPQLRKKYQIWYYYYPTGTPWLTTATHFRDTLNRLTKTLDPKGRHKNLSKIVIIAHSMGGLITRLSLSYPSNKISQAYLNGNDPLKIGNATFAKSLNHFSHFKPLKQPANVIFIATPHRGSSLASGFLGWTARRVISIPKFLLSTTSKALLDTDDSIPPHTKQLLQHGETAVDQLQPSHPAILTLNAMPMRNDLKVHSIIGDIGLPIGLRFCTDGVVSYKSSHLPFATSETIVPTNHDTTDEDETINAVISILK